MQITVEQAMNIYPLSEGNIVAGASGIQRMIKAVNIMDAPDIADWIKEGEMLFTTAFLIKDDLDGAVSLIKKLNARGLAALGFKLGRFWQAIPQRLIEVANELGLPLIELPYQYTFSDQMNGLFHAEMKRNTQLLESVMERQLKLMRYALQTESVGSLFQNIEEIIGCKIAVIGSKGQVIHNGATYPREWLVDGWPWNNQKVAIRRREWHGLRVPFTNFESYGGFVYFFNESPYITPVEEALYVQAAELITHQLTFLHSDYLEQSAQKDFGILIRQHLKHGLSVEVLSEYAERWEMGWLTEGYRCILIEVDEVLDASTKIEKWNELKTAMLCHAAMQALKGIYLLVDDGILVVIPDTLSSDSSEYITILDSLIESYDWVDWHEPRVVIGNRKRQLTHLLGAYNDCKETLSVCRSWGMLERVVLQDAFDLTLIFQSVPEEKMRKYYTHWLADLLPGGRLYTEEMYLTLETYLDCDGSMNETAKRLFVHRNTAAYRIEKLSELIGVDLKGMNYVIRLKLALLFYRTLEGK